MKILKNIILLLICIIAIPIILISTDVIKEWRYGYKVSKYDSFYDFIISRFEVSNE